ncbi:MFS transporter [Paenibacillus filicis]|uniref:MFS transporter n=1 Tax=Paenibacillus gyeongsangnamensis TaxID=3388067 RepID=A0ABT4QLJ1_9BACL|nr:MFS transporter [Paenibacillus filicis]MCZ8517741.1 MFS transporter [Paenibacillus filicis]
MKNAAFESNIRAGLKEWIGLAVLSLPALLVSVDLSIMILALPHISVALGADSTGQLWIMDIYGFMLSGFLITMGTLGDRLGRRKLLMIGAVAFGMASLLASFSNTAGMLIAARALLGIAGATVSPSTLALISNMFRDHKQRSLAIGIWFMCSMGGMALGPVVGGTMLEHFPWRAIFLLGVPVMSLLLATAPYLLPEYRDPASGRLDIPSVVLSLCAILPAIYGLKEIAKQGLQTIPLIAVAAGATFGTIFVRRQQRLDNPLMDLRLFTNPAFSVALGGMFGITLTGASMLFVAQHLQFVEGLSPLRAAMRMLPGVVASMAGMLLSPIIARRIRPSHLIGAGLAVSATGCILLSQVGVGSGLLTLIVGYIFFNVGAAPFASLSSDLIVGSAPPEKAGSAASLLQTSGEFAFALGIAVLGSIGTYVYRSQVAGYILRDVPTLTAGGSRESLAGAVLEAKGLPQPIGSKLLHGAQLAYTGSMHAVVEVSGVLFIAIAILSVIKLRHIQPIGQKAPGEMELSMQEQ